MVDDSHYGMTSTSSFPVSPKLMPSSNNDDSQLSTGGSKQDPLNSKGQCQIITKMLSDDNEKNKKIQEILQDSPFILICCSIQKDQFTNSSFFKIIKTISPTIRDRHYKGIRWITTIGDKDDINIARLCLSYGISIRHVDVIPSSFVVSDKESISSISSIEDISGIKSILFSNDPLHIQNFHNLFNTFWGKGIDAEQKISAIEKGVEHTDVEMISNPFESLARTWNIVKNAEDEILILFSTANAILRQVRMGGLDLLKETVSENESKNKNVEIRMLIPFSTKIEGIINTVKTNFPKIKIRMLTPEVQTNVSMVLADQKECLTIEVNDDTKSNSCNAIGTSIHYKNKPIVSCYHALFDSFWKQAILYEQLKEAHEQLQIHDKMQNEFINIVAHELRTPIQPILCLTQIIKNNLKDTDEEQKSMFDVIIRNTKRLQLLIESILDITKIEGNMFVLSKEKFSMTRLILSMIQEYKNTLDKDKRIEFEYKNEEIDIEIYGDRTRLSQLISNLINNSVKFIPKAGKITISIEKKIDNNDGNKNNEIVIISVKDTGIGIDNEILPRLFEKFVSNSFQGTGLGLYISRKIIEAHGGRIWAQNNNDGRGATFSFSLAIN
ncbi:MAG: HAMP domain-containing histidine kinase [Thermoproteota archaeon]|nr:HAMP domain-containing histidine kinase [Thermoproteota archaeon]